MRTRPGVLLGCSGGLPGLLELLPCLELVGCVAERLELGEVRGVHADVLAVGGFVHGQGRCGLWLLPGAAVDGRWGWCRLLGRLCEEGLLERVERGVYRLRGDKNGL